MWLFLKLKFIHSPWKFRHLWAYICLKLSRFENLQVCHIYYFTWPRGWQVRCIYMYSVSYTKNVHCIYYIYIPVIFHFLFANFYMHLQPKIITKYYYCLKFGKLCCKSPRKFGNFQGDLQISIAFGSHKFPNLLKCPNFQFNFIL